MPTPATYPSTEGQSPRHGVPRGSRAVKQAHASVATVGKGGLGTNEYEKAQHRALMRIARIERKQARLQTPPAVLHPQPGGN